MHVIPSAELDCGDVILKHGEARFKVESVEHDRFDNVKLDAFDLKNERWTVLMFNANEPVSLEG